MQVNGCWTPTPGFFGRNYGEASVSRDFGGNITLDAGKGNDQINVARGGDGMYHVNVNGQDFSFTRDEMSRLTIKGGKGDDQINIASNVDVPIKVEGGKGNDQINNHANGTRIDGGKGHDH